jgi:hypothetical protein
MDWAWQCALGDRGRFKETEVEFSKSNSPLSLAGISLVIVERRRRFFGISYG